MLLAVGQARRFRERDAGQGQGQLDRGLGRAHGKLVQRWKLHDHAGFRVAFLDDKTLFALTNRSDTLFRFDVGVAEPTAERRFDSFVEAQSLAVSPTGVWVSLGDGVQLFDLADLAPTRTLACPSGSFVLSRDGKRLAIDATGGVAIVAVNAPTKAKRLAAGDDVRCLAWMPSGALLCGIGTKVVELAVK